MSSIPSGGNFIFADFETPRCQFCTKMPDLCYLGKTRIKTFEAEGRQHTNTTRAVQLSCDSDAVPCRPAPYIEEVK